MPVNGMVYSGEKDDELLIKSVDSGFMMFEIIVANIKPNVTNGTFVQAGDNLGFGKKANSECTDKYIHLAVRKHEGQSQYKYIDPSVYVDHIDVTPKWIQECKEFTFKHIGSNVDAHGLGGIFKAILKELKERALEWAESKLFDKLQDLFPDSKFVKMLPGLVKSFQQVIHAASDLANTISDMDGESFSDFSS